MIRLTTLTAAAALLLPIALAAQNNDDDTDWLDQCRNNRWHSRPTVCEVRHQSMRPGAPVAIDGRENGGIAVRGWDRDSVDVELHVQAQAPTEQEAREIAAAVRVTNDNGTLHAEGPTMMNNRSWSVSYSIQVPRQTDLRLDTHNGPIAVQHVRGKMELHAINGPLALSGAGGDVHGRTSNGPLAIDLEGSKWDGAGLDAETSNGPIELTIPERYSAKLETSTMNGPMDIDIPITITGRFTGKRINTTLGDGGPTIRAVTTNGPLTVHRAP
jgi:hypothetical protein